MSDLIATFFKDIEAPYSLSDPLRQRQAIYSSFKDEKKGNLFQLALYCKNFSIDTLESWIEYHRSLLCLLFLRKFYKKTDIDLYREITSLVIKGKTRGFGKKFCLQKGYEVLIDCLLNETEQMLDFHQLEKGAVLYRYLPHPLQTAEMGLIALYLGLFWDDPLLLEKGLKCAQFSSSLYDPMGKLFEGVWLREQDYPVALASEAFALLFEMACKLSPHSKFQQLAHVSYKDPFILLFKEAFQKLSFPSPSSAHSFADSDRSLGCFRYDFKDMSTLCSVVGENTGFGSIHKKEIHIVSMGPHYFPLGDSDYYGIFRTSDGRDSGLKDLKIEREKERGSFQGWTQSYYPKQEKRKNWIFFSMDVQQEKIDLKVRIRDDPCLDTLFYVFFVYADQGIIGEDCVFYPAALERYEGKVEHVLFKKGNEKMTIFSNFQGEMILIPLAGKEYFWSANFLLAFSLKKKLVPYHWTVN